MTCIPLIPDDPLRVDPPDEKDWPTCCGTEMDAVDDHETHWKCLICGQEYCDD